MAIKLAIAGQAPVELEGELITVGRDPGNTVPLSGYDQLKGNHVVFRLLDGRWVCEVCEADSFFVGGKLPKKAHWLSHGDVISLSLQGPAIQVQLSEEAPLKLAATSASTAPSAASRESKVSAILPESDPLIPVLKPDESAKQTKSLSSTIIQIPKAGSPKTQASQDPPSTSEIKLSKTMSNIPKVGRPQSSMTIPTTIPLSDDDLPAQTSGEIRARKSGQQAKLSDSNIANKPARRSASSAQIPILKRNSDEVAPGTPVLKRLSSYEMPVAPAVEEEEEFGGAPKRRRSKKDEAEMRWIKSVVTKAVVIGGLVLLVLIGVAEVWKALQRTNF